MNNAEARDILIRYMVAINPYISQDLYEAFKLAIDSLAQDEDDHK